MKKFLILFFGVLLFANPNKLFNEGKYIQAAKEYLKIGSQEAIYDAANAYYRARQYQKAIELYKQITKPSLKFKALYNLGNAYAFSKEFLKAKEAYEKALKIKKDKDAEYNLKIIEKLLKKKHKKQNNKQKQNKNNNKQKQNKKQHTKNNNKNKKQKNKQKKKNTEKQNKNLNHPQKEERQNNKEKQKKSNRQKKPIKLNKNKIYPSKEKIKKFKMTKETNTSDIRERYYEIMLKNLKFNTLLLPLRSGENEK